MNIKFFMEGTILISEEKIEVGVNLPNVWDISRSFGRKLTTDTVKFRFDPIINNEICIQGIGVGVLQSNYRCLNVNNNSDFAIASTKKIRLPGGQKGNLLPGTLTIKYSQYPDISKSIINRTNELFPSNIDILIDITKTNINIHWRKQSDSNEGNILTGSTDSSVISIARTDYITAFKFAIICKDYCSTKSPLYISVHEISGDEFKYNDIFDQVVDNSCLDIHINNIIKHEGDYWTNFNIGKYAVVESRIDKHTIIGVIEDDGENIYESKYQSKGDDSNEKS